MKTYATCPKHVADRVAALIRKFHPDLHKCKVRVDLLFVSTDGEGPALTLHGYACAAVVRKLGPPPVPVRPPPSVLCRPSSVFRPPSSVVRPLFWTVTGRDFGRANAWARARGNPVATAIRTRLGLAPCSLLPSPR